MRHLGGKMLDTRTRLQAAMPADRNASSNEVSFSRCLPTPLVKNISFGTNPTTFTLLARLSRDHVIGSPRQAADPGAAASRRTNVDLSDNKFSRVGPTGTQHGKHRLSHCQGIARSTGCGLTRRKPA